jgi:hypothetical protein
MFMEHVERRSQTTVAAQLVERHVITSLARLEPLEAAHAAAQATSPQAHPNTQVCALEHEESAKQASTWLLHLLLAQSQTDVQVALPQSTPESCSSSPAQLLDRHVITLLARLEPLEAAHAAAQATSPQAHPNTQVCALEQEESAKQASTSLLHLLLAQAQTDEQVALLQSTPESCCFSAWTFKQTASSPFWSVARICASTLARLEGNKLLVCISASMVTVPAAMGKSRAFTAI